MIYARLYRYNRLDVSARTECETMTMYICYICVGSDWREKASALSYTSGYDAASVCLYEGSINIFCRQSLRVCG